MELKLFGKSLFEIKTNRAGIFIGEAQNSNKQSKFIPDFYQSQNFNNTLSGYVSVTEILENGKVKKDETPKPPEREHLTPKDVHNLKLLHDETFELKTEPEYVDQQILDFSDKLALLKAEEYDMARGVTEIGSILMRLENRKKYDEFKTFFEEFPYTTTSKIDDVVKAHDYLKMGQVAQFVADIPKEAVEIMKQYNKQVDKLCAKQAVFYIVADKKDFEKTSKRRDPILLAQSPFGHFWQILGAWDKEMLLLENL